MLDVEMDGPTCRISLHGTDRRNLITWDLVAELKRIAIEIGQNRSVRAVVLASCSDHFTMGFDINDATTCFDGGLDDLRAMNEQGGEMCDAWAAIPVPTICVIDGVCVGGGVALA